MANRSFLMLSLVSFVLASGSLSAAPVIFTLEPLLGSFGTTLTGSITVNDDGDGRVIRSEITDWSLRSEGGGGVPNFLLSSANFGGLVTCNQNIECFNIQSGDLVFGGWSGSPFAQFVQFYGNNLLAPTFGSASVAFLPPGPSGAFGCTECVIWSNYSSYPTNPQFPHDQFSLPNFQSSVIARPASVVPEPSSMVLLGTALAFWFGVSGMRYRKRLPIAA